MKPIAFCVSIAAFSALLLAGDLAADEPLVHTKESLQDVKKNVEEGKAVIVDVREQREWDAGHLQGAILAPQSKLRSQSEVSPLLSKLSKDKIIYTHCRAGGRALACGEILKKQGYDVRPLKAGFQQLVEAGFEKAEDTKKTGE